MGNNGKKERQLSEKEQMRAKRLAETETRLAAEGYVREDVTISIVAANVLAVVFGLPFFLIFGIWYVKRNSGGFNYSVAGYLILIIGLVAGIVVHELIHGLVWGICAPSHFKTIEFGIVRENMTPYCTCGEPIGKSAYILGAVMPCVVLGIIPSFAAVYLANFVLLMFGFLMILGAGGDLLIIYKMLLYKADARDVILMDHPTECGFVVFKRKKS